MNLQVWALMFTLGFSISARLAVSNIYLFGVILVIDISTLAKYYVPHFSVRVSNELGAGNPKGAKFTIGVNVFMSTIVGTVFSVIILATKTQFPRMFSNETKVISETSKLGYILALTIFITSIQAVLHGMYFFYLTLTKKHLNFTNYNSNVANCFIPYNSKVRY